MKHVLDTVDDGGPVRAFQDAHDALESQEVCTAVLAKRLEKERQRHRSDRISADDRIGIDVVTLMRVPIRNGLRSQPRLDSDRFGEWIVDAAVEKPCWVDLTPLSRQHRRGHIEVSKPADQW